MRRVLIVGFGEQNWDTARQFYCSLESEWVKGKPLPFLRLLVIGQKVNQNMFCDMDALHIVGCTPENLTLIHEVMRLCGFDITTSYR